mgnify:CR=1 FL=1
MSDQTPVEEKNNNPEYALSWLEYIYWMYHTDRVAITSTRQFEILELRKYAEGRQDWQTYKKQFTNDGRRGARIPLSPVLSDVDDGLNPQEGGTYLEDVKQSKAHFMAVDFEKIFSPAPKYMNALTGMFLQTNHDISVNAMDSVSVNNRIEKKWALWVKGKNKAAFDEINKILGIDNKDENESLIPNTIQELELYSSLSNSKLRYEVAAEEALIHTESISDQEEIKTKAIRDLAIGNCMFMMDTIDEETYKVRTEYLDPTDVIIEYSSKNDFRNSRFGGYIMYYTVSQLMAKFPNKEEGYWLQLAGKYEGKYGNPNVSQTMKIDSNENPDFYDFRIPVIYGSWRTVDYISQPKSVEINPKKVRKSEVAKGKIKQVKDRYYKMVHEAIDTTPSVYEGKWILGTDLVFDYGRIYDDNGTLPIHGYILKGNSIVEQMIPSLDQIQMTYLRLQNAIAKSPPPGLVIDVAGVKGFSMGNAKWRPLDLIKMYTHTGHMLYDSSLRHGNLPNDKVDSRKVIDTLPGGLGNAINEYLISFEMAFNHLAELTGLSRESFVGNTNPNKTATATRITAAGTTNTLQPVYNGYIKARTGCLNSAISRIQIICMNSKNIPKDKGYYPVIGEAGVEVLASYGRHNPHNLGVQIKPAPTQDEKMEIQRQVMDAQAKGLIPADIAMFITIDLMRGNSLNKIQAYLSYQLEQGRKKAQEIAEANQLRDRETQVVVAEAKFKSEAELETLKFTNKQKEIELEKNLELRNAIELHKINKENISLNNN